MSPRASAVFEPRQMRTMGRDKYEHGVAAIDMGQDAA